MGRLTVDALRPAVNTVPPLILDELVRVTLQPWRPGLPLR